MNVQSIPRDHQRNPYAANPYAEKPRLEIIARPRANDSWKPFSVSLIDLFRIYDKSFCTRFESRSLDNQCSCVNKMLCKCLFFMISKVPYHYDSRPLYNFVFHHPEHDCSHYDHERAIQQFVKICLSLEDEHQDLEVKSADLDLSKRELEGEKRALELELSTAELSLEQKKATLESSQLIDKELMSRIYTFAQDCSNSLNELSDIQGRVSMINHDLLAQQNLLLANETELALQKQEIKHLRSDIARQTSKHREELELIKWLRITNESAHLNRSASKAINKR